MGKQQAIFIGTIALLITITIIFLVPASPCGATPVFYLSPGYLHGGADLDGDLDFQASVAGYTFIEDDFDEYPSYGYPGPTLNYGAVDVTLSMDNGNVPRTWQGWWNEGAGQPGGLYGAVYGRALPSYGAHHYTFSFSGREKVVGFGIWVFDDYRTVADNFTLTVVGLDDSSWTSGVLDANPGGLYHAIDGFIGVTLLDGIKSVTINNPDDQSGVFHLDHMQVAATPEPGTLVLLLLGSLGACGIRWKKR